MAFSDQGSSDFKQHLNLSESAWNIISYDRFRFSPDRGKQLPLSTFLNHIFQEYYPQANASIALRLEDYRKELTRTFSGTPSDRKSAAEASRIINLMVENRSAELKEKTARYPHGYGQKFRLNKANYGYLTGTDFISDCRENLYYNKIGQYLKAVFEEYAALTHLQREAIYYKDIMDIIYQAKELGKTVRIVHNRGFVFDYRVYDIMSDQNSSYHYLVGYSNPVVDQSDKNIYGIMVKMKPGPSSMRLSNIKLASMRSDSGKMSPYQRAAVESRLKTNGPDFMSEAPQHILLYLSDEGIASYNYQLSIRPNYREIIDEHYYSFYCTARQIKYYFLQFGANVRIIYPEQLRQDFAKNYETSLARQTEAFDMGDSAGNVKALLEKFKDDFENIR